MLGEVLPGRPQRFAEGKVCAAVWGLLGLGWRGRGLLGLVWRGWGGVLRWCTFLLLLEGTRLSFMKTLSFGFQSGCSLAVLGHRSSPGTGPSSRRP
jgi:hypothetical protein